MPLGSGANFRGVASSLKPPADADGALINPAEVHDSLIEAIVEVDEQVTEKYFEGVVPDEEDLDRLIGTASVAAGSLMPIVCCVGQDRRRRARTARRLRPLRAAARRRSFARARRADEEVEVKADPAGPLVAQVFKTRIDPFVQKLSYIRVFSGTMKMDDTVAVIGLRKG